MWFAGIDWADAHHDVAVVDEAGRQHGALRVAHSAAGLEDLLTFLRRYAAAGSDATLDPEQVACIVETTHGLLITALLEAGFPVYPVNPKTLEHWHRPSGAKTDQIDAYLLARKGRSDLGELRELRRLAPDSPLVQELKLLTRDQDALVQTQTRLVNQLTACLKAYFPGALTLFSKLQQGATLAFLQRYPTLEQAETASVEELTTFLRSLPRFPGAVAAARRIHARLHQPQLRADPVTTRVKARLTQALVAQLLPVVEQIAVYDEEIERLFRDHPDAPLFVSLPGAGKRLAPRLLVGWGDDRERYASAQSMQGLAGTAPVAFQSGKYTKAHKRYAGIKPLRNALYQFAWQSTKEAWALEYYQRKRREGKSHSVALRALANQWVRLIHAMWRNEQPYDEAIFRTAQETHARPAA
jgi:Transposase/Transposase IS116/IS110/IS902 family